MTEEQFIALLTYKYGISTYFKPTGLRVYKVYKKRTKFNTQYTGTTAGLLDYQPVYTYHNVYKTLALIS